MNVYSSFTDNNINNMMRYNVHDLQHDIDQLNEDIKKELIKEDKLSDQVFWDNITIKRGDTSNDGWDEWEAQKCVHYLPDDIKIYQQQIRVRLRLEKKKRILEMRIKKIQLKSNQNYILDKERCDFNLICAK